MFGSTLRGKDYIWHNDQIRGEAFRACKIRVAHRPPIKKDAEVAPKVTIILRPVL